MTPAAAADGAYLCSSAIAVLPDDQKTKMSQAYRRLRGMPPAARNELLNSDEFRNNFTDDERDLLAWHDRPERGPHQLAQIAIYAFRSRPAQNQLPFKIGWLRARCAVAAAGNYVFSMIELVREYLPVPGVDLGAWR